MVCSCWERVWCVCLVVVLAFCSSLFVVFLLGLMFFEKMGNGWVGGKNLEFGKNFEKKKKNRDVCEWNV